MRSEWVPIALLSLTLVAGGCGLFSSADDEPEVGEASLDERDSPIEEAKEAAEEERTEEGERQASVEPEPGEGMGLSNLALEALVLAIVAGVVTAIIFLAGRFPVAVSIVTAVLALALAVLAFVQVTGVD